MVAIERIEQGRLHVTGLDIIDNTPVLDLKPYIPDYDYVSPDIIQIPPWYVN